MAFQAPLRWIRPREVLLPKYACVSLADVLCEEQTAYDLQQIDVQLQLAKAIALQTAEWLL